MPFGRRLVGVVLAATCVLTSGCDALLSEGSDAGRAVCDDVDALYQVMSDAPGAGPSATFAAIGRLSSEFRVDELMLRDDGNNLANAVGYLANTLASVASEDQSTLGLQLLEDARQATKSIAEEANC